ncbi:bacterioferritin (cytochrome b1) [Desulfitispora alkaliphila]|uniref:hypothetical protein n=1 Tax=Desulfitispora alkaliphila TaxID=622674 RepID=UPI003D193A6F
MDRESVVQGNNTTYNINEKVAFNLQDALDLQVSSLLKSLQLAFSIPKEVHFINIDSKKTCFHQHVLNKAVEIMKSIKNIGSEMFNLGSIPVFKIESFSIPDNNGSLVKEIITAKQETVIKIKSIRKSLEESDRENVKKLARDEEYLAKSWLQIADSLCTTDLYNAGLATGSQHSVTSKDIKILQEALEFNLTSGAYVVYSVVTSGNKNSRKLEDVRKKMDHNLAIANQIIALQGVPDFASIDVTIDSEFETYGSNQLDYLRGQINSIESSSAKELLGKIVNEKPDLVH